MPVPSRAQGCKDEFGEPVAGGGGGQGAGCAECVYAVVGEFLRPDIGADACGGGRVFDEVLEEVSKLLFGFSYVFGLVGEGGEFEGAATRGAWTAMGVVGWYVLVPMALGSWVTGLVMSPGSRWGLFRHYWVVFSFVLTTLATVILIAHMPDVSSVADAVATANPGDLDQYGGDLFHSVLALVLLLLIQVLNLYKPTGMDPVRVAQSPT